jgi:hypothetical protein
MAHSTPTTPGTLVGKASLRARRGTPRGWGDRVVTESSTPQCRHSHRLSRCAGATKGQSSWSTTNRITSFTRRTSREASGGSSHREAMAISGLAPTVAGTPILSGERAISRKHESDRSSCHQLDLRRYAQRFEPRWGRNGRRDNYAIANHLVFKSAGIGGVCENVSPCRPLALP